MRARPGDGALRLDFPFTPTDTPHLRRRIERDLGAIASAVRAADPGLESLVLVGGYARGEGTARDEQPVNDYDLIAIRRTPLAAARPYERLAASLGRELGIKVDLATAWAPRLPLVPRTIFWYEAREGGRTVLGLDARTRIRPFDPSEIPLDEGVRLLFNRAAGLVVAADPEPDPFLLTLQAAKAHLACTEALLVLRGAYHWSLAERQRRAARLVLPDGLAHVPKAAERATAWKLGDAAAASDASEWWEEARSDLLAVLGYLLGRSGTTLSRSLREDGWRERFGHLALSGRFARAPTARLRAAGLELLAACDHGRPRHAPDLARARRLLDDFGPLPPESDFAALKARFLALRHVTVN